MLDRLTDAARHFRFSSGFFNALTGIDTGVLIRTFNLASAKLDFQAFDVGASGWETLATLQSHATQPYFEISKAGNIIPAAGDTYNLGSLTKYWGSILTKDLVVDGDGDFHSCRMFLPNTDIGFDSIGKIYWDDANQDLYVYCNTTGAWEKVHLA